MVTNPTFLRVPDPSNGTGKLTQHPSVALDQTVARWLREGAPRVNSRSNPNPATRPFVPAVLFSFFDGAISLPQCSQLIAQHFANSSSHVRTAAQEFTRTEGAPTSTPGRILLTQSHPPGLSAPSLFDYDTDFPHPIGAAPKGKGKGKGRGEGKGKGKRKGKDTPSEASPLDSPREGKGKGTGKTK